MKHLFLSLMFALGGVSLAHTAVTAVSPAQGATVAAPQAVRLTFSEPIELRFSTLRVMALPAGQTAQVAAQKALSQSAESAALASRAHKTTGLAAQVSVPLKPGLKPGLYVVAWKLLSEDGHPVTGLSTFRVK
ncbi:copper resistance protein CopC [Deinococcus sp. HMF7620]|uniref:Copper resistance protein CopC n=1 Tax=Deinococcus arboris TaxID=2682977 RepID=A0A7C9M7L3_9DEIO|nr:copper resistance CopC family protein [Deinococcus arboris]MVN86343.1 copper resistance protein CopC [Deinococcus arboris]